MTTSLTWVDAFSATPFGGNPAGVCLPSEPMADEAMQSLAFELGIAETAYVIPNHDADAFDLRWFSPATEIDLCGHATLASAHVLRERGVIDGRDPVTFHTRSGPLIASFDGDRIELDFPAAPMHPCPMPESLRGQWDEDAIIEVGQTGFFTFVVLDRESAVRDYQPDLAAISAVPLPALLLTAAAEHDSASEYDFVVRVFGPNVGIDEDPATGSAQCTAGPYWAAALGRAELEARQVSPRGAVLYVRPAGERVHIGGHAVTIFSGDLC